MPRSKRPSTVWVPWQNKCRHAINATCHLSRSGETTVASALIFARSPDSAKDDKQRSYRGVNFFQSDDLSFLLAIMRGEYQIAGFTNRVFAAPSIPDGIRRK